MPIAHANSIGTYGATLASPSVAEKGSINMRLSISTRGGHSSFPPPHTSIGLLSRLVTELESHPFEPRIGDAHRPDMQQLLCKLDAPQMPAALREALLELVRAERSSSAAFSTRYAALLPRWWKHISSRWIAPAASARLESARQRVLAAMSDLDRALVSTTQAVDVFHGGIKVNALPERAEIMVNHRVALNSNLAEVIQHYEDMLTRLAATYNFSVTSFGRPIVPATNASAAHVTMTDSSFTRDTLPQTPFTGQNASAWRLLSRVIRQTWHLDEPRYALRSELDEDEPRRSKSYMQPVRVAPSTLFASTDTAWYVNLTAHVIRFAGGSVHPDLTGMLENMHTVNEHISIDAAVKLVDFYTNLMVAAGYEDM